MTIESETIERALITGATGFVGRALSAHLGRIGVETMGFGGPDHIGPEPALDVTDSDSVEAAIRSCDPSHVFHLAANCAKDLTHVIAAPSIATNLLGTTNVVSAAARAGVSRVVVTGTAEEYGPIPTPFREADRERPTTVYGLSKFLASRAALAIGEMAALEVTVLRVTVAYGPGQPPASLLGGLSRAVDLGERYLVSDGTQTRDYIWIDDVADALVRTALAPAASGKIINIGSGDSVAVASVVRQAAEIAGHPELLALGEGAMRPGEQYDYAVDLSLASELLGWLPPTKLEDGLGAMFAATLPNR